MRYPGLTLLYASLWLAAGLPLDAQPATTTVADTLRLANGTFCGGTIQLTYPTFYSSDGYLIQGGSFPVVVNPATGQFSVTLVPTNTSQTPAVGFYAAQYSLRPNNCAPAVETWSVPEGGGTVNLTAVRTVSTPPPPLIPVASLNPAGAIGGQCVLFTTFVQWGNCATGSTINGTAHQIEVVTASGATTISLPPDLILSGQSANGTDVIDASRFTDTTPTGNFLNFKSAAGSSLWNVDITGTLQAGAVPFARLTGAAPATVGTSIYSGNGSGGFSDVTVGTGLSFTGGTLSAAGGSGTVTSFAGSGPSWLTWTVTDPTTAVSVSLAPTTGQTSGRVIGTCGTNTTFAPCQLAGSDLPDPTATTLGGIESLAAVSHKWINTISTAGAPTATQPAFTDISGSVACSQLPALTGDTTTSAGACATTTSKLNGGSVPTSAAVIGTNSSSQPVAATQSAISSPGYAAGGGSANAQTVTLSPAVSAYAAGLKACWLPADANTSSTPTLNLNGVGAETIIKTGGAALANGDLSISAVACVVYDGTYFELQNPQTSSAVSAGITVVQGCVNSNSGSPSSIGCAFPANLTAGNTLEVCVMDTNNSLSGITWSGDSGTFTTDLSNKSESTLYMDCAHVVGLTGGGATITGTVSLNNAFIVAVELHGVTTGLDQSDAGLGGSTQYVVGNAVTTTHSNEIAIGCLFMATGIWGVGYSNFQGRVFATGAPPAVGLEVQMLPGPQTLSAIGLQASSNYEISHIVTFY